MTAGSRALRSKPRARRPFPLTTDDKRTAARSAYRGCEQQGCSLVLIGLRLRYAYQGPRAAIRSIMAGCAVQDRPNSAHSRVRISKRPKIHTRSKFAGRRKIFGGTWAPSAVGLKSLVTVLVDRITKGKSSAKRFQA